MSRFFDTNVLVYAFLDIEKRERAIAVLAQGGVISAQVLNEFTHAAHKKHRRPWADVEAALGVIRGWFRDIVPLTSATHGSAVSLARDHGFAFHDALIVAAALEARCSMLYSEDMQHMRKVAGLTIVNPFGS